MANDYLFPLYYPKQKTHNPEAGLFGIGSHSDLWTILLTDNTPGLQLLYENEWHTVARPENTFTINIADSLQKWTNDIFKSAEHTVVMDGSKDRYSVPYFAASNWNLTIDCLPNTVIPNDDKYGNCNHEPYIAGKYLDDIVEATVEGYGEEGIEQRPYKDHKEL